MAGKCFRCGRYGHFANDCFASTNTNGKRICDEDQGQIFICFHCHKPGHFASECFARQKEDSPSHYSTKKPQKSIRSGVYVLQYPNGNIYVGKSANIDKRIEQHISRNIGGASCTKEWTGKPREIKPISIPIPQDLESWERNETLAQIQKHGIDLVRGWKYTNNFLTEDEKEEIESQLCEKYDLCRICGKQGHFASDCTFLHKEKSRKKKQNWRDKVQDLSSQEDSAESLDF